MSDDPKNDPRAAQEAAERAAEAAAVQVPDNHFIVRPTALAAEGVASFTKGPCGLDLFKAILNPDKVLGSLTVVGTAEPGVVVQAVRFIGGGNVPLLFDPEDAMTVVRWNRVRVWHTLLFARKAGLYKVPGAAVQHLREQYVSVTLGVTDLARPVPEHEFPRALADLIVREVLVDRANSADELFGHLGYGVEARLLYHKAGLTVPVASW